VSLKSLETIIESGVKLTPMMEQYYELKKTVPDLLLLFRMGDFYEVFFEDAQKTARLLNITLTHRGKLGDFPIPMAGIPHHAANAYIDRLTSLGEKVAICEQIEDPKEAKGIVKRGITQIASPGMPFDLEKADPKHAHYMAAASKHGTQFSLVVIDYTTGQFMGSIHDDAESFLEKLKLYSPREFLSGLGLWDDFKPLNDYLAQAGVVVTYLSAEYFEAKFTDLYTEKMIPGFKRDRILKLNPEILSPIGALAYYICSTQDRESYGHIQPFKLLSDEKRMRVTQSTLSGLEILPRARENYKSSVLGFLDRTQTAMGSRQMRAFFLSPLMDIEEILQRQNLVSFLLKDIEKLEQMRESLSYIRDLERIFAKLATGKASASDLIQTASAIEIYHALLEELKDGPLEVLPKLKKTELNELLEFADKIRKTLNDEIGASLEKGNLIRAGFNPKRDKLARLANHAASELIDLETRYREETGLTKLRIKSNNVNGYFIEVSKGQSDKMPKTFTRRQTLVNAERFVTKELLEFEKEVLLAKDKLEKLEREIFKNLCEELIMMAASVRQLSQAISYLDCFQSFAFMAHQENLSKPEFISRGKLLSLKGAWHPLIRTAIKDQFVPHDLLLDESVYFGLITGPNMAGKTTVMREVAIIQLLSQIGSFVPAARARLSLCDYLFSRLGASDDILKGQSTFMVEMSETAEILRHATEKSLIILDEVGRGTSTYDGLSIAWSLVEHFVKQTRAITLFATHYHELIEVVDQLPQAKNLTVETQNQGDKVQFLYRLIEQAASQSFGLYVAKLAGLPKSVLDRSQTLLTQLEADQPTKPSEKLTEANTAFNLKGNQLCFLSDEPAPQIPDSFLKLRDELKTLDILTMTPLQAMQKLHDLKQFSSEMRH